MICKICEIFKFFYSSLSLSRIAIWVISRRIAAKLLRWSFAGLISGLVVGALNRWSWCIQMGEVTLKNLPDARQFRSAVVDACAAATAHLICALHLGMNGFIRAKLYSRDKFSRRRLCLDSIAFFSWLTHHLLHLLLSFSCLLDHSNHSNNHQPRISKIFLVFKDPYLLIRSNNNIMLNHQIV